MCSFESDGKSLSRFLGGCVSCQKVWTDYDYVDLLDVSLGDRARKGVF